MTGNLTKYPFLGTKSCINSSSKTGFLVIIDQCKGFHCWNNTDFSYNC